MILMQQRRGEIPTISETPDNDLLKKLNYLYPGYELIRHQEGWCLYWCKQKGGGPSDDLMIHQFTLPISPGPWLFDYMAKCDRGERTAKDILDEGREMQTRSDMRKARKQSEFHQEFKENFRNRFRTLRGVSPGGA
jgi:hypothetical protein